MQNVGTSLVTIHVGATARELMTVFHALMKTNAQAIIMTVTLKPLVLINRLVTAALATEVQQVITLT